MVEESSLKVIYILGFGRSGTTILSNVLGESDGFFHLGELHYLWRELSRRRVKCGCRSLVPDCPFWSEVVMRAYEGLGSEGSDVRTAFRSTDEFVEAALHLRNTVCSPLGPEWNPIRGRQKAIKEYAPLVENVLHSVAEITGARVLVDSSKLVQPAYLFEYMPSISPYFVHVVRDPRGSVLSRQRKSARVEGEIVQLNHTRSAADCVHWMWGNLMADRFARSNRGRFLRINYETFATQPKAVICEIMRAIGGSEDNLPFVDEKTVVLRPNHSVCGNQNRFKSGEVTIRLDDRWGDTMRKRDRAVISTLTSPLLLKYGYSLWA